MHSFWVISHLTLWGFALLLGILLLGTLRNIAILRQCLSHRGGAPQRRMGGLKVGTRAPDFVLASSTGTEVALHDFAGRKVLLAFLTGAGSCPACEKVVEPLNKLQDQGDLQVLAVKSETAAAAHDLAHAKAAHFPVLVGNRELYDRYQVERVPLCFLINEQGLITAKVLGADERRLWFLACRTNRVEAMGNVNAAAAAVGTADFSFPFSTEGGPHDRANGQAS